MDDLTRLLSLGRRPAIPHLLHPAVVFSVAQIAPLILWLILPDRVFEVALQGYARANLSMAGLLAFGCVTAAFAIGTWLGLHLAMRWPVSHEARVLLARGIHRIHLFAVLLSSLAAAYILLLVGRSGVDVLAIVLAAQANLFKEAVYTPAASTQLLIMGRHLLLASLISWFVANRLTNRRSLTLLILAPAATVIFLFTSSRLTLLGAVLIGACFWAGLPSTKRRSSVAQPAILTLIALLLTGVFAGGVWLRSAGTWTALAGTGNPLLAPVYEAAAYFASPVNYSFAFVNEGVAFVRGAALDHFFAAAYTVGDVPVEQHHREAIGWYYNPSLNQLGLVGEWFTITGPLLWLPALLFGTLAGVLYWRFRLGSVAGLLLYPVVLISIGDSMRGFLLPQNISAANLLFLGAATVFLHAAAGLRSPSLSQSRGRPAEVL